VSINFLLKRIANAAVVLCIVAVIVFGMIHIVPGDPARLILGERARVEDVEALRERLGFDKPLHEQFRDYVVALAHGDFGESIRSQQPAIELVMGAVPATLQLVGTSLVVAFCLGIPLGVLAAVRRGKPFDRACLALALIGQSVPAFWIGLILISVVALRWGLLPTSGYGGVKYLILPVLSLVPYILGMILRVTRVSVIEVLDEDYIRTARAKGLHPWLVVGKHAVKNAAIPIITVMGLQIGALLGGAIITETVFAWPGMGRLAVNSLGYRDWPVVTTVILVSAFGLVIINLIVDVLYTVIDTRIRFQ
jgi:ABC-type dipeptide/oligopeptide/nickel transport system permease component